MSGSGHAIDFDSNIPRIAFPIASSISIKLLITASFNFLRPLLRNIAPLKPGHENALLGLIFEKIGSKDKCRMLD